MAVLNIQLQSKLPEFDMPDQYKQDKWPVQDWDYYKNSKTEYKFGWNKRSNKTNNQFDFTLCENEFIREELKYFMYHPLGLKKVTLSTFGEYYDRFKVLSQYINIYMKNNKSLLELDDLSLFEFFLSSQKKKVVVKNGKNSKGVKNKNVSRRSRYITFIEYLKKILYDYYNSDIPETQKLMWNIKKLKCLHETTENPEHTILNFSYIKHISNRNLIQKYCLYKLDNETFDSVYNNLNAIKCFAIWLEDIHSGKNFSDINRDIVEEYYLWLKTQSEKSLDLQNIFISKLKSFFDWGILFEINGMPKNNYILSSDYNLKQIKESKTLTAGEVQGVISIIPKLNKLYGKILCCLII